MDPAIVYAVLFCAGCLALAYAPAIWEFFQDLWNALRDRVDNLLRIQPTVLRRAIEPVGREALPAHDHLTPEDVLWLVRRDWVPPQATVDRLKELAAKTNAELEARERREEERQAREELERWRARRTERAVKERLTEERRALIRERDAQHMRVRDAEIRLEESLQRVRALTGGRMEFGHTREAQHVYVAEKVEPIATYYLD